MYHGTSMMRDLFLPFRLNLESIYLFISVVKVVIYFLFSVSNVSSDLILVNVSSCLIQGD